MQSLGGAQKVQQKDHLGALPRAVQVEGLDEHSSRKFQHLLNYIAALSVECGWTLREYRTICSCL